MNENLTVS